MPLTTNDIPTIAKQVSELVVSIRESVDLDSAGGKRLTTAEVAAILAEVGELVSVLAEAIKD